MIKCAYPTRGNDRDGDRIGNRPREGNVVALLRAVAVHRGQENFSGTQCNDLLGIADRFNAGGISAAVGEKFPSVLSVRL